jgi:hypothetical protein
MTAYLARFLFGLMELKEVNRKQVPLRFLGIPILGHYSVMTSP